jgi:hypothetical protein
MRMNGEAFQTDVSMWMSTEVILSTMTLASLSETEKALAMQPSLHFSNVLLDFDRLMFGIRNRLEARTNEKADQEFLNHSTTLQCQITERASTTHSHEIEDMDMSSS